MSLDFGPNPKVYGSGGKLVNMTIDPSINGGTQWIKLAQQRWPDFTKVTGKHPLAHDGDELIGKLLAESRHNAVNPAIAERLRLWLKWDGAELTRVNVEDINRIEDPGTGLPWSVSLDLARVYGSGTAEPGEPATPPVTPPPVVAPPPRPHPAPEPNDNAAILAHLDTITAEANAVRLLLLGSGFHIAGN